MIEVYNHEHFMREALRQARLAYEAGEIPVGAVIVHGNQILAKAYNQTEMLKDVTAHAEMLAITSASNTLGGKYLKDCTLYVSLEPCVMCAGASFWSQISKVVFAASDPKRGFERYNGLLHPKTVIVKGIMEVESEQLINSFFERLRNG